MATNMKEGNMSTTETRHQAGLVGHPFACLCEGCEAQRDPVAWRIFDAEAERTVSEFTNAGAACWSFVSAQALGEANLELHGQSARGEWGVLR